MIALLRRKCSSKLAIIGIRTCGRIARHSKQPRFGLLIRKSYCNLNNRDKDDPPIIEHSRRKVTFVRLYTSLVSIGCL
jgi:hypothetical protein